MKSRRHYVEPNWTDIHYNLLHAYIDLLQHLTMKTSLQLCDVKQSDFDK